MKHELEIITYQQRIEFLENELAEAKLKILELEQQFICSTAATHETKPSCEEKSSQYDSFDTVHDSPVIEKLTAEMLTEVAESSIAQSSYVYDPDMRMYYDNHSKCYYDAEKALYYEPNSGVYYSYDEVTQTYKFHSKINSQDFNMISHIIKNKTDPTNLSEMVVTEQSKKKKTVLDNSSSCDEIDLRNLEVEEGEILSNDEKDPDDDDDDEVYNQQESDQIYLRNMPETYMSCIRAVVKSSDCLRLNSLFILTCKGASMGRDQSLKHDIIISDPAVSRLHCSIKYNEQLKEYSIIDEGSVSGTYVNEKRIGEAKETSAPQRLQHLDQIRVGQSTIEIHIHPFSDTCHGCEPWNLKITSEEDKVDLPPKMTTDQQRRFQLKLIKKKYGLKNMNYERPMTSKLSTAYEDRSKKRRLKVGSDHPVVTAHPTSVNRALPESNIGHKMLKKMGWKNGQSLGKSQAGILEPIKVEILVDEKASLGTSTSVDNLGKISKLKTLMITRKRYENASIVTDESFSDFDYISKN